MKKRNKKVQKILATLMISTTVLGSTGFISRTSVLADETKMKTTDVAPKPLSIKLNTYNVGYSSTITGTYNGTNAVYMRAEVNGEKKQIFGSKELAEGKISYYIGNQLKSTDNVELILFDKNYKELGRQKLTIKDPVTTTIKLDTYVIGKSDSITGSYNGTNAVYVRAEVNGEKQSILKSKELAEGKINYYIGKGLKTSDNVELILFDKDYKELGHQKLTIATAELIPDPKLKEAINKQLGKSPDYNPQKEDLQKITELRVPFSGITNLEGLEYCTNLQDLDLNGDQYSDLSPIANLTKLRTLGIANNQSLSDISSLKNLTNLVNLYADYSNISDLSALSNMTNLEVLHIPFNPIKNLNGLENCKKLRELDLNGDQYSDLTPIANLTELKTLGIANNKNLSDISSLKNLTNLVNLYADNCNISDISVLANLTNLRSLHIPGNPIKNYDVLKDLHLTDLIK